MPEFENENIAKPKERLSFQDIAEADNETNEAESEGLKKEKDIEVAREINKSLSDKYEGLTGNREVSIDGLYRNMAREKMLKSDLIPFESSLVLRKISSESGEIPRLFVVKQEQDKYSKGRPRFASSISNISDELIQLEDEICESRDMLEDGWVDPMTFQKYVSNSVDNVLLNRMKSRLGRDNASFEKPSMDYLRKIIVNRKKYELFSEIMNTDNKNLKFAWEEWKNLMTVEQEMSGGSQEEIFLRWMNGGYAKDRNLDRLLKEYKNRNKSSEEIERDIALSRENIFLAGRQSDKSIKEDIEIGNNADWGVQEETPIKFEGEFDVAKELQDIRRVPRSERKKKIMEFKDRLVAHKEGISKLRGRIVSIMDQGQELTIEQLKDLVHKEGSVYGMNVAEEEKLNRFIDSYERNRLILNDIMKNDPSPDELYDKFFGRKPVGKIDIFRDEHAISFVCHDIHDFAIAYNRGIENPSIMKKLERMGGFFAGDTPLVPDLDHAIIVERWRGESAHQGTYAHEKQHAINSLFNEDLANNEEDYYSTFRAEVYKDDRIIEDHDKIKQSIRKFIMNWGAGREELHAKDEILACLRNSWMRLDEFPIVLTDGSYDYFSDEIIESLIKGPIGRSLGKKYNEIVDSEVMQMRNDHYNRLRESMGAVEKLVMSGYSKDDIINLLQREPFRYWNKTVDRILNSKNKL